ncbi:MULTISPECIES: acyloxyacyl hydrolase [Halomonadaceae]|uniref:acyloxyacyl hydrolase n=1 Tax=Halomonadaceae TaxID=28256 RepID=UPI0015998AD2|nr:MULTISPECIES: acyloxyacyl hydrolase [Halomonas]QJQ95658.1 acyloxyacyl hydrolase [Halomonas sp. PA5]
MAILKQGRLAALLLSGTIICSTPTLAHADLYFAAGATSENTVVVSIEIDRDYSLQHWHPQLSLRLATGVLLLPGDEGDDNAAWRLTPAFRYTFAGERGVFAEAGIGAGVFLNTHLEGQELSTAFQFEDRLAIGIPFAGGELGASLMHYSNAGIKRPNDGFETLMLSYRTAF